MDLKAELALALELLGLFEIYDSVPNDHGYVGSTLQRRTTEFRVRHGHPSINTPELKSEQAIREALRRGVEPALGLDVPDFTAEGRAWRMEKRLSPFTHWVVNTKPHIYDMVDWLRTNDQIFAVIPTEEGEGLVLCTDQAGWDMLHEGFDRRPDVDLGGGGH